MNDFDNLDNIDHSLDNESPKEQAEHYSAENNETHETQENVSADNTENVYESNSDGNVYESDFENAKYEQVTYSPIKKETSGKGVKIFSAIMAVIILMTASCAAGYMIAGNKNIFKGSLFAETNLDLEDKPDSDSAYTTGEVYEKVNKSVVGITVYNSSGIGSVASGVIYTEDGYIITNDHIYSEVEGAEFVVQTYDGKVYDAEFVAGDTRSDLAVLKVDATGFYPASFGNSQQITVGESTVAIGRPNGIDENSITRGIISLKERRVSVNTSYTMRVIQTDTPINPGNSGGALVNMYGQVIGITSSKIGGDKYEGIGFAIPTTVVKSVVESLIQHGYVVDRCKLGITFREIDVISQKAGDYPVCGIMVAEVTKESDLYSKVSEGDIITAVNGIEITSDDVVLNIIEDTKPDEVLQFTVYKPNGSTVSVSAKTLPDTGSSSYKSELSAE